MALILKVLQSVTFLLIVINVGNCYDTLLRQESISYGIATIRTENVTYNASLCAKHLSMMVNGINERIPWALKMMDSSGRPRGGFLWGNNYWLGTQSQCMAVQDHKEPVLSPKMPLIRTQEDYPPYNINFFVAYLRHNFSLQTHIYLPNEDLIELGLCLPLVCTTEELSSRLRIYFDEKTLNIQNFYNLDFELESVRDLIDDHKWLLSTKFIVMTIILLLIVGLAIIGTAYDVIVYQPHYELKKSVHHSFNNNMKVDNVIEVKLSDPNGTLKSELDPHVSHLLRVQESKYKETRAGNFLMCFSLYTNTKTILNTNIADDSIPSIHGLRFLGMMWIIMVHNIFYMADFADNKPRAYILAGDFFAQIVGNSIYCVDTFFFLSGFLIAYLFFKAKKGKQEKRPNIATKGMELLMMTARRFIRLTPAYVAAIVIFDVNFTWYNHVSPFYIAERIDVNCPKYWWRNILYINNLFSREEMCLSWSWYLSNDMQFFIIGSFLLLMSTIYFKASMTIIGILIVASCISTGYISYIYEYVPTLDEQYKMLNALYDPPWTRIGPYLVGIIAAYYVVKFNGKLHMSKRLLIIGWIVGPLLNLGIVFGLYDRLISVEAAAVYVGLSRTVWGIGLAWLILMCTTNHAGIINKILSFKGWVPLSRITYSAYLLNPMLIYSLHLDSEYSKHVEFVTVGLTFLGTLFCTYICAFAFSLLFETPVVLLLRLASSGKKQKDQEMPNNQETATSTVPTISSA